MLFTPTLSHRLWRCQLPDAKTQFVASLRCEKLLVVLMSLCDGREHIWVSGDFKNCVSQVGYISPEILFEYNTTNIFR